MKICARRLTGQPALIFASTVLCGLVSSVGLAQTPAPPEPPSTWTGTAGLGVSITSGNSDTITYNVAFDITRTPKAHNVMTWTGQYLRGDQNTVTVVDRTSPAYRDEYALSGRTYALGQAEYLRDTFKRIDYLVAPTAGLGFKVLDSDARKFTVLGGGGTVSEKNTGLDVRTSAALTAGEKVALQLTPSASIKHAATGLWNPSDVGDSLYPCRSGLRRRFRIGRNSPSICSTPSRVALQRRRPRRMTSHSSRPSRPSCEPRPHRSSTC